MTKIFIAFLSYILIFFNTNLLSNESEKKLKVGLLAPFSGEYKYLGNSLLLSIQLALDEIDDNKITIVPRNSGSRNKEQLKKAIEEIIESGAKIIIGPVDSDYFDEIKKFKDVIFISLSNKEPEVKENIISIGISLESQMIALENFIIKQKKRKTIIMYPENQYAKLVEKQIKKLKLKNYKTFKYNPDPKVLTGEIEKLTNYAQRKRNLEIRKKLLKEKEDEQSLYELKQLEQRYTLGKVNFDSVIIIDFGNSLKSVLASLAFVDIDDTNVLFTTVNQWFDESIFYENSVKNLYYPSVNLKDFRKYNNRYLETFNLEPNEITILGYDALGLIYYVWKKNGKINSINDFFIKNKIKGKIGSFKFENGKIFQDLNIYKTDNKEFIKY